MKKNDHPTPNLDLERAIREVKAVMARYKLAGACMLISPAEAVHAYQMSAPWSAIITDPDAPARLKFRTAPNEGARLMAALHTINVLSEWSAMTLEWMQGLKAQLRQAGIDFEEGQPPT